VELTIERFTFRHCNKRERHVVGKQS